MPHENNPLKDKEKLNARGFPVTMFARHMEPGLCGYDTEKILVDADAMKRMCASFNGKPIYVFHQKVDLENIQQDADGYVTECFYNENDGWLWAKMLIVSDDGKDAIAKGWSVSNAYIPTEFGSGGSHHNVPYDRKVLNANFTHLAIVPDPRYEGARIFTPDEFKAYNTAKRQELEELKNSKGMTRMFGKIFKSEKKEVTNASEIDDNTSIELQNGKTVTMKQMVDAVLAQEALELANAKAKKNAEGADEEKKGDDEGVLNSDTEVCVGDKKMPLGHLMNKYMNMVKQNELDEEEKKKKEEKENSEKEEKENALKADELKKFNEMKNAKNGSAHVQVVETAMDQVARGKAKYGSGK